MPAPIEIIGGGLAGLALGLGLRRRGVGVAVYETGDYPRHRVCGEFITGLGEGTIECLGLHDILAGALTHRHLTYYLGGRALRPFELPAPVLGISRHVLDARLASAFVGAGGLLHTRTRGPGPDAGGVPGRVFAVGRSRRGPTWIGLKIHARGLALEGDCEIHLGDHAYVGLSGVEDGAVNVCGLFRPRELTAHGPDLLPAYLKAAGLEALAERLATAEADPSSFCVTAASLGDPCVRRDGLLRVGDACATPPPFTGNGMAMALQGAEIALDPLTAYAEERMDWDEARHRIGTAQSLRFRRRLTLSSLLHPLFLTRRRQACLAALVDLHLVPFNSLYAGLH